MFARTSRTRSSGNGGSADGGGADHIRGFLLNQGETGSDIRVDAHQGMRDQIIRSGRSILADVKPSADRLLPRGLITEDSVLLLNGAEV